MRKFGYWFGVGLLIAGGAAAVAELLTMLQGAPATLSIGAIWYRIHANSLVGFQGLIERGLSPLIWPPIQWLLVLPTWLVLVPPGLALVLICRDRGAAEPASDDGRPVQPSHLEGRQKRLLRHLDLADLAHALFALLLRSGSLRVA